MSQPVSLARRALVIDDGPLNVRLTKALLEKHGCIVDTAASGEEAVERCAKVSYDAIFVDLHMPGMDGRTTIERVRESEQRRGAPRTPVVLLTADDVPPVDSEGWFDLFMSKPVTSEILAASFHLLPLMADRAPTVVVKDGGIDLVDEFLRRANDALDEMESAFEKPDYDAIVESAHGLKGTAAQFGFSVLSEIAASLERGARQKSRTEVDRWLLELDRALSLA